MFQVFIQSFSQFAGLISYRRKSGLWWFTIDYQKTSTAFSIPFDFRIWSIDPSFKSNEIGNWIWFAKGSDETNVYTYILAIVESCSSLTTRLTSALCLFSDIWKISRKSFKIRNLTAFSDPCARNVPTTLEYDSSSENSIAIRMINLLHRLIFHLIRDIAIAYPNAWALRGIHLALNLVYSATFSSFSTWCISWMNVNLMQTII